MRGEPKPNENWCSIKPGKDGVRILNIVRLDKRVLDDVPSPRPVQVLVVGRYLDNGKMVRVRIGSFLASFKRVITSGTSKLLAPLGSVDAAIKDSSGDPVDG